MRFIVALIFFLLPMCFVYSQDSKQQNEFEYEVGLGASITDPGVVPFWLRTNTFGDKPTSGASGSFFGGIKREFRENSGQFVDWSMSLNTRTNVGRDSKFIPIEAFIKGRIGVVQLHFGREGDIVGIVDTNLSAGAFSVSGNAPGIPKLEVSIPVYQSVPFTKDLIALKGSIAHGWLGKVPIRTYKLDMEGAKTYYHQLSLYGRIGKPSWSVKFYGGINHQVMWGSEQAIHGSAFELSKLKTFWYVVRGKEYGNSVVPTSKVGDHLGSVDQAVEYEADRFVLKGYHQFFYTAGGLFYLNNVKDGLWGISLHNKSKTYGTIGWKRLTVEFMNTKSQGGEIDAPLSSSGTESYYQSMYSYGWTYNQENLGSNFLTNRRYARADLPMRDDAYIVNNRVQLFHLGFIGFYKNFEFTSKLSLSQNFGTYETSPIGASVTSAANDPRAVWINGRKRIVYPPPYFSKLSQFSGYLAGDLKLKKGLKVGAAFAVDQGGLLYNSAGAVFRLTKSW